MLNKTLMCVGFVLFLSSPFEEYLCTPHRDLILNIQVLSATGSFLNKTHEPFIPETLRSGESPQKIMIQLEGISSWEVKEKPHQTKRYWSAFCLCWEPVSLAMAGAGAQLSRRGRGPRLITERSTDQVTLKTCPAQDTRNTHSCQTELVQQCSVQFSSVAQSCPTLCDPMDCSTPGFPVYYQLLELAQTHGHQVGDTIQPSHPLLSPSPPSSIFPGIRV